MEINFDEVFFNNVLCKIEKKEDIEIMSINNKCVTEKGVNFLSDLFKVSVKYKSSSKDDKETEHTASFMIKTEPLGSSKSKLDMCKHDFFLTEFWMLSEMLPRIEKLVGHSIGPKTFYCNLDPRVFVMEDMCMKGFIIKDRQKGLSESHCLRVIEQIARLHAGSVALYEKNPEIAGRFRDGIITIKDTIYLKLMEVSLLNMSQSMYKWPEKEYQRIAGKLEKWAKSIGKKTVESYDFESNEFCVLNHGDCWINNIIFREDEKGNACEAIMIDYQMSVYTSPAIDLLYFLNICPELSLKCDKDDFFLGNYLKILTNLMTELRCKTTPPTMKCLKDAMYKRRAYAIFAGIVLYPRMMANKEDTEDFNELCTKLNGETRLDVFKNPQTVKAVRKMIQFMDKNGYLD